MALREPDASSELNRMWKETHVTYIEVLSRYLRRGIDENSEKPQHCRCSV